MTGGEHSAATVAAVSCSAPHAFSKAPRDTIRLVAGLGVDGDAHLGETVQHLSRVARDPTRPNLRQVHLMHGELHDELVSHGFAVGPGDLGENVTTRGLDLLSLPSGSILQLGPIARVRVTGLRNPCLQLDRFQDGLLKAVLNHDDEGRLVRKAGVMGIVLVGGEVRPGDRIDVELPPGPAQPLEPV